MQKILRTSQAMYLYSESPKFNLSHNIKPVIIESWNRKLYFHLCFSSFSFGLFILFIYLFIYLSIYLFTYLSIYLFIYLFIFCGGGMGKCPR